MATFRELVERYSSTWMLSELAAGFWGVTCGMVGDTLAEGQTLATRMPWILDDESPDDVLPFVGSSRGMPRYPAESAAQYRVRIHAAWDAYDRAGDEDTITSQLESAGFPGAVIYTPDEWPTAVPIGYSTQFWVFFPAGTHNVTGPGPIIGTFTIGDGSVIGPTGISIGATKTIRSIIKKWKSSRWICRRIIFEISGWTIGTGHLIGEPGLVIGGETASIGI